MPLERATFLSLPSELRNVIYSYVFDDQFTNPSDIAHVPQRFRALPSTSKFDNRSTCLDPQYHNAHSSHKLDILRTCRQIQSEAHLLALSLTPFRISGDFSSPDVFDLRSRPLSPAKIGAIKHLTLTARINNLRALNEAWAGLPFGHPSLHLDALTIVPRKPDCSSTVYAEVADLSQSHTLAYIFSETLKGLRNVNVVEVRNQGCFNDIVWRVLYRSLVYRMWRWGGENCGVRFECSPADAADEQNAWIKVYLQKGCKTGNEVGEEVLRLGGGEMPDPNAGVGP